MRTTHHSSRGRLPFPSLHHAKRTISQLLTQGQVTLADETRESRRLGVAHILPLGSGGRRAPRCGAGLGLRIGPLTREDLRAQRLKMRVILPASASSTRSLFHPSNPGIKSGIHSLCWMNRSLLWATEGAASVYKVVKLGFVWNYLYLINKRLWIIDYMDTLLITRINWERTRRTLLIHDLRLHIALLLFTASHSRRWPSKRKKILPFLAHQLC